MDEVIYDKETIQEKEKRLEFLERDMWEREAKVKKAKMWLHLKKDMINRILDMEEYDVE